MELGFRLVEMPSGLTDKYSAFLKGQELLYIWDDDRH